jgi:hypothetical protein
VYFWIFSRGSAGRPTEISFYGRISQPRTTSEGEELLERQAQIGSKPSELRELFPNETCPDLKNRFHWLKQDNATMRK